MILTVVDIYKTMMERPFSDGRATGLFHTVSNKYTQERQVKFVTWNRKQNNLKTLMSITTKETD